MGLCNRGKKGNKPGMTKLQNVTWTGNLAEWIPQPDDVQIASSSAKVFASSRPAKHQNADGGKYMAFPVFPADEWDRIYQALHPNE